MKRYMLRLSYIGTNYRGAQKHSSSNIVDLDSIQGTLETSLLRIKPWITKPAVVVLAGRTDVGVHALNTAAHFDLEHISGTTTFDADNFLKTMNRYLINCNHDIRILSCHEVSLKFHARYSAKRRSYLYRLLYAKDPVNQRIPIAESHRTLHIRTQKREFDIERVKKGLELFRGTWDFKTFSAETKDNRYARMKERTHVRTLDLSMERAQALMPFDPLSEHFHYWNIIFHSRGFLYNQIRRIVGSLQALGWGRINEEDIMTMLQVPSHQNWDKRAVPVPPHGLYLMNVEYDEADCQQVCSES